MESKEEKIARAKKLGIPSFALRMVDNDAESKRQKRIEKKNRNHLGLTKAIRKKKEELRQLGLKKYHFEKGSEIKTSVTSKQAMAIAMLVDFEQPYSPDYIAAKVGVSTRTFHNWRNDPVFIRELDKEITRRKTRMRLEAYRHLFRKLKTGNTKILFKYLEMTGDSSKNINLIESGNPDIDGRSELELDAELEKLRHQLGIDDESDGTVN